MLLTLAATLPALLLTAYIGVSASATERSRAQDETYRFAQQASARQDDIIVATRELLTVLAQDQNLQPFDQPGCSATLASLLSERPEYTNLFVADQQGYSTCSGLPLPRQTYSGDRQWFQRTVQTRQFAIGDYVIGRGSGKPVLTVAYPVIDAQGNVQAVLSAGIDLAWLNRLVATTKLPVGSVLTVYDRNDVVLAHAPGTQDWVGKQAPPGSIAATVVQRRDGVATGRGLDGKAKLFGFVPLGAADSGVYVVFGVPTGSAFAVAHDLLLHSILALAGVMVLALVAAWAGGHWLIVRQVRGLVASTAALGRGDLGTRAGTRSSSAELHQLTTAFNSLAAALQQREQEARRAAAELEANQAHLARIIETMVEGVVLYDADRNVTLANAAAARMLGKTPTELVGQPLDEQTSRWRTLEGISVAMSDALAAVQRSQQSMFNRELVLERHDGQELVLSGSAFPLAEGDGGTSVVTVFADITERKQHEVALQHANRDLSASVAELRQRNEETAMLSDLSGVLQACRSETEAMAAIRQAAAQLFPVDAGAVYLVNASQTLAEAKAAWGSSGGSPPLFQTQDCWALRRGRPQSVAAHGNSLPCAHVSAGIAHSLCLPMLAQGAAMGVLHLESATALLPAAVERLAQVFADQVALALANVRLRETLQQQATRDPLTGLFNRRYLQETLEREQHRAIRRNSPLALLMLDLDHFKQFNDRFGHPAGDAVLRVIADFLVHTVRGEDIVCRYGGEELLIILPDTSLESAALRAEQLRQGIKQLQVPYQGQLLGTVSVSVGVAFLDADHPSSEVLLRSADAALYRAKAAGRDQIAVAEQGDALAAAAG